MVRCSCTFRLDSLLLCWFSVKHAAGKLTWQLPQTHPFRFTRTTRGLAIFPPLRRLARRLRRLARTTAPRHTAAPDGSKARELGIRMVGSVLNRAQT